ncbi:HRAS-like suppressor 2 [Biomphalaria pfeifferi]|uniref:HRAS-like suppressor 2 n=1 Tax=Biomphalaria pfeifferi TaxID=112525 RepID=A0AAD8C427_BIOPF|nr:HRAS-like suppressor 2 [Biomphalaria pfeifferi]
MSQGRRPKPGDRIEIKRGGYSHWAIYIGDNKVVHLTGIGGRIHSNAGHVFSISGQTYDKAMVAEELIKEVVGESEAYINNERDSTWKAFDPDVIVKRAKELVGKKLEYNILYANCENFVNYCRYGKYDNDQASNAVAAGSAVVGVAAATVLVFALILER